MKNKEEIISAVIMGILSLASGSLHAATTTASTDDMEKCYAIVKASMNDCQTATQSCAGSATKDKQGDAFLFVPKGLCNKIVGGSLTPETEK